MRKQMKNLLASNSPCITYVNLNIIYKIYKNAGGTVSTFNAVDCSRMHCTFRHKRAALR